MEQSYKNDILIVDDTPENESEPRPPPAVPEQVDVQYVPFFDT
jgi:hypothetical protein